MECEEERRMSGLEERGGLDGARAKMWSVRRRRDMRRVESVRRGVYSFPFPFPFDGEEES
jgi:hypothetical protein